MMLVPIDVVFQSGGRFELSSSPWKKPHSFILHIWRPKPCFKNIACPPDVFGSAGNGVGNCKSSNFLEVTRNLHFCHHLFCKWPTWLPASSRLYFPFATCDLTETLHLSQLSCEVTESTSDYFPLDVTVLQIVKSYFRATIFLGPETSVEKIRSKLWKTFKPAKKWWTSQPDAANHFFHRQNRHSVVRKYVIFPWSFWSHRLYTSLCK